MRRYTTSFEMPNDVPALVLGAGVSPDGSSLERGASRLDMVTDAIWAGVAIPAVVLSGGKGTDTLPSEADAFYTELHSQVPAELLPQTVLLDRESTNTTQNLLYSLPLLQSIEATEVAIPTDPAQIARVGLLSERIFPKNLKVVLVQNRHEPTTKQIWEGRTAELAAQVFMAKLPLAAGPEAVRTRQEYYDLARRAASIVVHKVIK